MPSIRKAFNQIFINPIYLRGAGSSLPDSPLQAKLSPALLQTSFYKGGCVSGAGTCSGMKWTALGECFGLDGSSLAGSGAAGGILGAGFLLSACRGAAVVSSTIGAGVEDHGVQPHQHVAAEWIT